MKQLQNVINNFHRMYMSCVAFAQHRTSVCVCLCARCCRGRGRRGGCTVALVSATANKTYRASSDSIPPPPHGGPRPLSPSLLHVEGVAMVNVTQQHHDDDTTAHNTGGRDERGRRGDDSSLAQRWEAPLLRWSADASGRRFFFTQFVGLLLWIS